jgi:hypothetical protein
MLETNLRIVADGNAICLPVRYAKVQAAHITPKQMEQACGRLSSKCQIAAKPTHVLGELVALSEEPIPKLKIENENLTFTIEDSGKDRCGLKLTDYSGKWLVPALLERAVIGQVSRAANHWHLDSWRKWFQPAPFLSEDGFNVFRRFEVTGTFVEGVGVGIGIDISTAFFTRQTLGYFFARNLGTQERQLREETFARLTTRQKGQKGTLIYERGDFKGVCYFEKGDPDRTCGQTPEFRINGRTYKNVYEYFSENFPYLHIAPGDVAVLVSFRGAAACVWVPARLLRIRVMNDALPDSLSSVDKIAPFERATMIEEFWALLGQYPFGKLPIQLTPGFWHPDHSRLIGVPMPALEFGGGQVLLPPMTPDADEYKKHFRQRVESLEKAGVYHLPPATERTLHVAYPRRADAEMANQLAMDIADVISKWTSIPFERNVVPYDSIAEATSRLRTGRSGGTVVFILGEEPAAYYETAFQLPGWRLKRVTLASLNRHFRCLREGAWDRQKKEKNLRKGWRKWDQYVFMNACDVLQQMDGIPYRVASLGDFEASIAIDVGHDRRYVAISLMIARDSGANPNFRIVTEVHPKTDPQVDTVNPAILADMIVQLFGKVFRGRYTPLKSLLTLRDGEFLGKETIGIRQAFVRLKDQGILDVNAFTPLAELHKSSQKNIRLWERLSEDDIVNPVEGTGVIISSDTAVVTTTGEATLHQGTAEPLMIVCEQSIEVLKKVADAIVVGAQLNWGSPGVAQRLPLFFKRTDEELQVRSAQEIRRIA